MQLNIFEESAELQCLFSKLTTLMAHIDAQDVLESVWNDSGSEASVSDSEYDRDSNSGSESEGIRW